MKEFNKMQLGIFPTPMYRLDNLSKYLKRNIWIKRDDMCGVVLGGNKVRKLEYLLYDAKAKGYDYVMTTGQAQSNHAMLTAACARKAGLDCALVLKKRGVTELKGNQILNRLLGVPVYFIDTDSYDDIYAEMDRIAASEGRSVYKIPCGGSNALGSLGYMDCVKEIADSGVRFDRIICACGSGGTAAGTVYGAAVYMPDTRVTLCAIDTDPFDRIVPNIMEDIRALTGLSTPVPVPELIDMCGPGYSIPSADGNEAIELLMRTEGILLDTCYTGKAFAGLIKLAREGGIAENENVLFIHTGGAGGLFAQDWDKIYYNNAAVAPDSKM